MLIGYARTSTTDQVAGLEAQIAGLTSAGCGRLFQERVSSVSDRAQLEAAIEFVREGDTFVVTKMDRLARSTSHLLDIVRRLEDKGVALRILDFKGDAVDTRSPQGRLLLTVFAAFAEFERGIMLERQRDGIEKAKSQGKYKGRKPTARIRSAEVLAMHTSGHKRSEIARALGIGRASVYRIIDASQMD